MLRSHLRICLNVGLTPDQLRQFIGIKKRQLVKKKLKLQNKFLNDVLSA